jgi:hypothetical protein
MQTEHLSQKSKDLLVWVSQNPIPKPKERILSYAGIVITKGFIRHENLISLANQSEILILQVQLIPVGN